MRQWKGSVGGGSTEPKLSKLDFPRYDGWKIQHGEFIVLSNSLSFNKLKMKKNCPWQDIIWMFNCGINGSKIEGMA